MVKVNDPAQLTQEISEPLSMKGQNVGYIRVSSVDQNLERQLDGIDLDVVFEDKVTGSTKDREGLNRLLSHVRIGDTVYVHDISRMARNTKHLLELVEEITSKGVTIKFMKESLTFDGDKSNPMNDLMLSMLGAVYQFERAMIRERQREGIEKAKQKGSFTGRRSIIDVNKLKMLLDEGLSISKTAVAMDVSISTVKRFKKKFREQI